MAGFVIVDGVERDQVEWLQEERRRLMTDLTAERERWTRKYAELEARYKSLLDTMVEQRHMIPPPPVIVENAAPVIAAERERCAKVCEEVANHRSPSSAVWLRLAAEEIRKGE